MVRDKALAIKLCEMNIERRKDPCTFIVLTEILIAERRRLENNIYHALQLCERSLRENGCKNEVTHLVWRIASGTGWMEANATIAVKLCQMYIAQRDVRAMIVLSDMYSTGKWGVQMDMNLAHEWYQRAVDEGWISFKTETNGQSNFLILDCATDLLP